MAAIDLGNFINTEHWSASIDLTNVAAVYNLTTASFLAQVRASPGSSTVIFEWKTGGSLVTPTNSIAYNNTSKVLTFNSPSAAGLSAFPNGGTFYWEVGFYIAAAPTDLRGIGVGAFPVLNGVIR
ncbi:MAG: hypothetical protein FJX45_10390 [Alphaproteobacteria bacterium]|nr:hypothetical protein [Alphaproteobacteria bacterium]